MIESTDADTRSLAMSRGAVPHLGQGAAALCIADALKKWVLEEEGPLTAVSKTSYACQMYISRSYSS